MDKLVTNFKCSGAAWWYCDLVAMETIVASTSASGVVLKTHTPLDTNNNKIGQRNCFEPI